MWCGYFLVAHNIFVSGFAQKQKTTNTKTIVTISCWKSNLFKVNHFFLFTGDTFDGFAILLHVQGCSRGEERRWGLQPIPAVTGREARCNVERSLVLHRDVRGYKSCTLPLISKVNLKPQTFRHECFCLQEERQTPHRRTWTANIKNLKPSYCETSANTRKENIT